MHVNLPIRAIPARPATEDMVTTCPFFCSIMPGRNAFNVQKWASVLTENVLTTRGQPSASLL